MIYFKLFFEFFKTGLFAVGGGLATVPFLAAMGDKMAWFTKAELANMIAISESTPGPIGINMATYVGYTVAGIPGSIVATLGEITPSIVVIMIVAGFLKKFKDNAYVKAAFEGIRPMVVGLISSAVLGIFTSSVIFLDKYKESGNIYDLFDLRILIIFVSIYFLNKKFKLHPAAWIGLGALVGVVLGL